MNPALFLLGLVALTAAMRDQSIAVTVGLRLQNHKKGYLQGKLLCGEKPAVNVRVKLWEEDTGPDPDDLLDQGYTDSNGEFSLKGGTAELTPIDPVFKVYHDCDDGIKVYLLQVVNNQQIFSPDPERSSSVSPSPTSPREKRPRRSSTLERSTSRQSLPRKNVN